VDLRCLRAVVRHPFFVKQRSARMSLARILKSLGFSSSRAARPATRRLALESLEQRWVPATLTVGNGRTHATIQAALAAARNGDTIVVFPGTYTVGNTANPGGLQITQSNLTLQAHGSNVKIVADSGLANDAMVDVTGTNDTIAGFTIDGNGNQSKTIDAAIEITHGGSATVSGNVIQNLFNAALVGATGDRAGTGVRVGDSTLPSGAQTGTATITDNVIRTYYRSGVTIDGTGSFAAATENTITGVGPTTTTTTQQYGVAVLNGAGAWISDNDIDRNAFNGAVRAGGVLVSATTARVVINDNSFNGDQDAVILSQTSNAQISDDDIDNGAADGILLLSSNNNTIRGNDLDHNGNDRPAGSGPGGGIALFDSSYNQIWNNDVDGSNLDALYIDGSNNGTNFTVSDSVGNDVRGNELDRSANGNGVYLFYTSYTTLRDNFIRDNSQNGILIQGGSGNSIRGSVIVANEQDGVQFLNTDNNRLEYSIVASNEGHGVGVFNSTNTTIDHNRIAKNESGDLFVDAQSTGTKTADNTSTRESPDQDDR
jgi:parallel beta-helix repeat protein